jgi:hypothetical protein
MPGAEFVEVKEVVERMFEIRFAGDDELMELINFMRSHLSHRFPKGSSFLEIFKYAMNYVKDREDLSLRKESTRKTATRTDSRYIPTRIKQQVWKRDNGRCTFVGSNNKRCDSDYLIQYDHHPIPYARGGSSTVDNLRLLCAKHNRHSAKKMYGEAAIKRQYIKETGPGYAIGLRYRMDPPRAHRPTPTGKACTADPSGGWRPPSRWEGYATGPPGES